METEAEICTALLHDVIEDTDYTVDDLEKMGFPPEVMEALQLLTRTEDVDYMTYVGQLKDNAIARKVKLADLHHNSDPARLENVTDRDLKRMEKYKRAEQILLR
jgi:(p)ppGpp synthase/HD superfamily hydrolase